MGKMLCAVVCALLSGFTAASAQDITEGQMIARMEQKICPADTSPVRRVEVKDRCQAKCMGPTGSLYDCSRNDPKWYGYDGDCQSEVTRINGVINNYNNFLGVCRQAARGGGRSPASVSSPTQSKPEAQQPKSTQQKSGSSDSPQKAKTEAGRPEGTATMDKGSGNTSGSKNGTGDFRSAGHGRICHRCYVACHPEDTWQHACSHKLPKGLSCY
jgi:hypothetical protein